MPLIVGLGLAVLQQLTGINTVIYYAPTIFQFSGLHSAGASIAATAGVGTVNVIATAVAIVLIDRVGRRPLLLVGVAGMVMSLAVLGAGFAFSGTVQGGSLLGLITAVSLMTYIASFAIGLGPVFWLLISEIYPLTVRGRAMGVTTIANWAANFLITVTFLTLVGAIGQAGVFWLYALVSIIAWFFVFRLVPETKGLTLEEIEEHFRAGRHPRELKGLP